MSAPKKAEEAKEQFLEDIRQLVKYWDSLLDMSSADKCAGVASSILSMIDGFDQVIRPPPDDKAYHSERGEDYYEDGMVINPGMLHDEFCTSKEG